MNYRLLRHLLAPRPDDEGGGGSPPPPPPPANDGAWKVSVAAGDAELAKALEPYDSPKTLIERAGRPALDDWRKHIAGDNAETMKHLERFSDLGAYAKAFNDTQTALRDGGRVKVPGEGATAEEIATFNKAIGVPEKAEDYKIAAKAPDGYEVQEADTEFLKGLNARMHKVGAPPSLVNEAHQIYWDAATRAAIAAEERAADAALETERTLKDKWGDQYKENIDWAVAGMKHFFPSSDKKAFDAFLDIPLATGHRLGDHPQMLEMFAAVGRANAEDPYFHALTSRDSSGQTLEKRKAEIMAKRNGTRAEREEYAKLAADGGELDRLNALIERRNASNGSAAAQ